MRNYLVVADTLNGGLGIAAVDHARHLSARSSSTMLLAPGQRPRDIEEPIGFRSMPLPARASDIGGLVRSARLVRQCSGSNRSVVYCHGARSAAAAVLAGIRPVLINHTFGSADTASKDRLRNVFYSLLPVFVRAAVSVRNQPGRGWVFVPHASPRLSDVTPFDFNMMSETPVLLWIGRLSTQKRPDVFIRALARLKHDLHKDVRGVIAGDGPLRDELEELAAAISSPVTFIGEVSREVVESELAVCWAVCLVSRFEGVPFSIEEAMWFGRAVVVSDLPGLRWLVGEHGVIISDQFEEVSESIVPLLDKGYAMSMGKQAADEVRSKLWPGIQYEALDRLG